MQRKGEILKVIVTIIVFVIVVVAVSLAAYVYISPQPIQIQQQEYSAIDKTYYNVDENELNGQWLETHQYTVDKDALAKYEKLKEFYKGRDNPFANSNAQREVLVIEEKGQTNEEEENNQEDEEIPID